MRKVTRNAAQALISNKSFSCDNTVVRNGCMFLHGNKIAVFNDGFVTISTCGWNTLTTCERLNGIPNVKVYQRRGELYLNDVPWDGSPIRVCVDA